MSLRTERQLKVGEHLLALEPPNLIQIVFHGAVTPEEARRIGDIEHEVAAEVGELLILADVSDLGDVPQATRKEIGALGRLPAQAVAVYGASFQARLFINMALFTHRLFIPKDGHSPVAFCATQEEGRQFLARTPAAGGGTGHARNNPE